jgi:hypothetical protein
MSVGKFFYFFSIFLYCSLIGLCFGFFGGISD